jgi:hypothetical protein
LLSELAGLTDSFHDVRLVCPGGGGEQSVQTLLLAAASPLLAAALLAADPDEGSQMILLPDFSIEEVRHFVRRLLVQGPESCSWGALDHLLLPPVTIQGEKDRGSIITSADINPNFDSNDQSVDNKDGVSDEEICDELDSCDEEKMEDFDTIDDPASVDGSRKSEDEKSAKLIDLEEAEALVASYTLFDETGRELGCRRCGKLRTRCRNTLRAHILSELGLFLFSCSLCDKLFRQKGYLNRHLRRHAEGGGRRKRKCERSVGLLPVGSAPLDKSQSGNEHNGGLMTEVEGSQEETYSSETEVTAEDITKECILQSAIQLYYEEYRTGTVPMPFYVSVTASSSVADPSVANPRCLSRIRIFSGSRIQGQKNSGSWIRNPHPHQRIYVF